jgi:formylglycine-generating enzyme required for sulfatase activity
MRIRTALAALPLLACLAAAQPVEFVRLEGGRFSMGSDGGSPGLADAKPVREVALQAFELSRTPVTVAQYDECVKAGACSRPGGGWTCNWGKPSRRNHPVNCLNWDQAWQFAWFKGARLPSEAEWEYAATSAGKTPFPWGAQTPDCGRAAGLGGAADGCVDGTRPVCELAAGVTAQGLCDMLGNVAQWVEDAYQPSYAGAPADGAAREGRAAFRVVRGGGANVYVARLSAVVRNGADPSSSADSVGFRLARSVRP